MIDTLSDILDLEASLKYGEAERCGLVRANGSLVEVPNIHEEPVQGFHMEPTCFLSEVQDGAVGTWHTHPGRDPNLSHEDMDGFRQWPQLAHHIIGIRDGTPTVHSFKVLEGGVVVSA